MKEPDMNRYYDRLDLMAERQREEAALAEIRAERDHANTIDDAYELTVVERIEAAERHYRQHDKRFADGLRHAAEIAKSDGWQHNAPVWANPTPNEEENK